MKKILSVILAAAMLGGALTGCGTKTENTGTDGKIQLSISNWPNEAARPKDYARMKELKEEFEAKNPDVEVVPDEWEYDVQTYLAKAEAGTLPILYQAHFTEVNKIKELGYASDLTETAKKYGLYDVLNEYMKEVISDGDKLYFVPQNTYTMGLVINKTLFEEAGLVDADGNVQIPETFDEVAEMAQTVSEKTGKAGFVFPTAENGGGWEFTVLAWNFGGDFMAEKDGKWVSTFGESKSIDALQWLKDMKWKYNAMPASTKVNNDDVTKLVGTNQAAMAIIHPGQVSSLMTSYNMDTSNIIYAKMPAGPERRVTLLGGAVYVVSNKATDEQIDAAYRWLEFNNITNTELDDEAKERMRTNYQTKYDNKTGIIGITDIEFMNSNAGKQAYKESLIEEFRNIPAENVASYDDKEGVEVQPEERICAQDLYSILDSCIQEVLTNENADCKEVMKKAASDFQSNFLDYEN